MLGSAQWQDIALWLTDANHLRNVEILFVVSSVPVCYLTEKVTNTLAGLPALDDVR